MASFSFFVFFFYFKRLFVNRFSRLSIIQKTKKTKKTDFSFQQVSPCLSTLSRRNGAKSISTKRITLRTENWTHKGYKIEPRKKWNIKFRLKWRFPILNHMRCNIVSKRIDMIFSVETKTTIYANGKSLHRQSAHKDTYTFSHVDLKIGTVHNWKRNSVLHVWYDWRAQTIK